MKANFDSVKMMRQLTLNIRATRTTELKWRIWLGVRLFYLAAWILNCNVNIESETKQ
jgi:hypothetical protein